MNYLNFSEYLDTWIDAHKDEIISSLLQLIAVPSVGQRPEKLMPFGSKVAKAFDLYLEKAASLGLITKNVDGYAVHSQIGKGKRLVMALSHIDVVPFGTGWTKNPYGEISNGKIFGRGAQDNKGPTIACLYGLKAIKDSNLPLTSRIRHVVGGNEESGFRCVKHYFKVEEKPDWGFTPDAMFPLVYAEKGSMNVKLTATINPGKISLVEVFGGQRVNMVPADAHVVLRVPETHETTIVSELRQYIPCLKNVVGGTTLPSFEFTVVPGQVTIECKGTACHSSVPWEGSNAIAAVLHLVTCLGEKLGSFEDIKFAADASEIFGKGLNIQCEDDISGRLSCNLGVCKTMEINGHKKLVGRYNIRYPVKMMPEALKSRVLAFQTPESGNVRLEVTSLGKSHYTDPDSHIVKTLLRIYREETGDYSEPLTMGGGTYAKVIPHGVGYGPVRPGTQATAHQSDEFISIDDLLLTVKIYARAMYELAH